MEHSIDDVQLKALGASPEFCQRFLAHSPAMLQLLDQQIRAQLRGQLDDLAQSPCGPVEVDILPQQLEGLFGLVAAQWERVGKEKPHWSVLSSDEFLPEALSVERLREFYASGEGEVRLLEDLCARNGLNLPRGGRCLEFGCGVGRVTLHLARRFSEVEGVDISAPNLAEARKVLELEGIKNAKLVQLRSPGEVSALQTFDVLFSRIVLQHNPPPIQRFLLHSLLGRLRKGGVALFQTVVHGRGYRYSAEAHLSNAQTEVFEMHALPMRYIFECFEECGCRCVEIIRETAGGFNVGSYTFLVQKAEEHAVAESSKSAKSATSVTPVALAAPAAPASTSMNAVAGASNSPKLSVITHVYNEQATMDAHVKFWKSLPADITSQVEFLCVDDFSDKPLKIDKGQLNLRLFRVTDDIEWNMPGCKNLAVSMSRADWLLFFDIDNLVDENGFRSIVGALGGLQRNTMYRFRRIQDGREVDSHINTMVLSKEGFFKAGWMDEDFAGHYGYDDVHFHNMWNKYVGNQVLITDIAFQQLNIRTETLNRDQSYNYELIRRKVMDEGVRGSVGKIRFNWVEVDLG